MKFTSLLAIAAATSNASAMRMENAKEHLATAHEEVMLQEHVENEMKEKAKIDMEIDADANTDQGKSIW